MTKKIQEKEDNYGTFICMLQVRNPEYRILFISVIVDAMGPMAMDLCYCRCYGTYANLKSNIKKLRFD